MSQSTTLSRFFLNALARYPDRIAVTEFRKDGDDLDYSYEMLLSQAKQVAAVLKQHTSRSEKILLAAAPGYQFLTFLLGCFLAERLVAPCFEPGSRRTEDRFKSVVDGFKPDLIISDKPHPIFGKVKARSFTTGQILGTATLDEALQIRDETDGPDQPVLVQFTSGSTSAPKGVMLSAENIISNLGSINNHLGFVPEKPTTTVTWLPPYHDLGLFSHLLSTLAVSGRLVIMKPIDFIRNPKNWLQAISDYRAAYTSAPDFAYRACTKRLKPADLEGLDLSSWIAAVNAAEPIQAETLRDFQKLCGPAGLSPTTMMPSYGLAESTVMVSATKLGNGAITQVFDRDVLTQEGHAVVVSSKPSQEGQELVALGTPVPELTLTIRSQEGEEVLPEATVGEVCLAGAPVSKGYYNNEDATEKSFGKGYLRTGDLGFVLDGLLYLTGRSKDLIILNGENFHPQDIEQQALKHLSMEKAIAVQVASGSLQDEVVLFVEKPRDIKLEEAENFCTVIYQDVLKRIGIALHSLILVKAGRLPLTSSGKVQRQKARISFEQGEMEPLFTYQRNTQARVLDMQSFIDILAEFVTGGTTEIDPTTVLENLRFDSLAFMQLETRLDKDYGLVFDLEEMPIAVADLYQKLTETASIAAKAPSQDVSLPLDENQKSAAWLEIFEGYQHFLKTTGILYDNPEQVIKLAQQIEPFMRKPASEILADCYRLQENQLEKSWYWYLPAVQEKLRYWDQNFNEDYQRLSDYCAAVPDGSIVTLAHMHGWEWLLENILLIAREQERDVVLIGDYREIEKLLRRGHNYRRGEITKYLEDVILNVNDSRMGLALMQAIAAGKVIYALPDTILAAEKLTNRKMVPVLNGRVPLASGIFQLALDKKLPLYQLCYKIGRSGLGLEMKTLSGPKDTKDLSEVMKDFANFLTTDYLHWGQWQLLEMPEVSTFKATGDGLLDQHGLLAVRSGEFVYLYSLAERRSVELYITDYEYLLEKGEAVLPEMVTTHPLLKTLFSMPDDEED